MTDPFDERIINWEKWESDTVAENGRVSFTTFANAIDEDEVVSCCCRIVRAVTGVLDNQFKVVESPEALRRAMAASRKVIGDQDENWCPVWRTISFGTLPGGVRIGADVVQIVVREGAWSAAFEFAVPLLCYWHSEKDPDFHREKSRRVVSALRPAPAIAIAESDCRVAWRLHTMKYSAEYLATRHWSLIKLEKAHITICQQCGRRARRFVLHHSNYARRGFEREWDTQKICQQCHDRFHDSGHTFS